jgi:tetratricopeptide (TPR) repeat protein
MMICRLTLPCAALLAAMCLAGAASAQLGPTISPAPDQRDQREQSSPPGSSGPGDAAASLAADRQRAEAALERADEGRRDEALRVLDEIVAAHPGERDFLFWRAVTREHAGRYHDARADYAELARLFPDDPEGPAGLGWIAWYLGEPAAAHFERALGIDPDNLNALNGAAIVALQAGDRSAGELHVRRSLELDPDNSDGLSLQGVLFAMDSRFDEAIAAATRAVEVAPHHGFAYFIRGIIHRRRGAPELALADLRRLALLHPGTALSVEADAIERELGPSAAQIQPTAPPPRR